MCALIVFKSTICYLFILFFFLAITIYVKVHFRKVNRQIQTVYSRWQAYLSWGELCSNWNKSPVGQIAHLSNNLQQKLKTVFRVINRKLPRRVFLDFKDFLIFHKLKSTIPENDSTQVSVFLAKWFLKRRLQKTKFLFIHKKNKKKNNFVQIMIPQKGWGQHVVEFLDRNELVYFFLLNFSQSTNQEMLTLVWKNLQVVLV